MIYLWLLSLCLLAHCHQGVTWAMLSYISSHQTHAPKVLPSASCLLIEISLMLTQESESCLPTAIFLACLCYQALAYLLLASLHAYLLPLRSLLLLPWLQSEGCLCTSPHEGHLKGISHLLSKVTTANCVLGGNYVNFFEVYWIDDWAFDTLPSLMELAISSRWCESFFLLLGFQAWAHCRRESIFMVAGRA